MSKQKYNRYKVGTTLVNALLKKNKINLIINGRKRKGVWICDNCDIDNSDQSVVIKLRLV